MHLNMPKNSAYICAIMRSVTDYSFTALERSWKLSLYWSSLYYSFVPCIKITCGLDHQFLLELQGKCDEFLPNLNKKIHHAEMRQLTKLQGHTKKTQNCPGRNAKTCSFQNPIRKRCSLKSHVDIGSTQLFIWGNPGDNDLSNFNFLLTITA